MSSEAVSVQLIPETLDNLDVIAQIKPTRLYMMAPPSGGVSWGVEHGTEPSCCACHLASSSPAGTTSYSHIDCNGNPQVIRRALTSRLIMIMSLQNEDKQWAAAW